MAKRHAKLLLVEGKEDLFAIAQLMAAHVEWGSCRDEWPVLIEELDGIDNLLAEGVIPTYLKSSEAQILGITVDANEHFEGHWQRIGDLCRPEFPDMPEELPREGLVAENAMGRRLGVWIMPDNHSRGMLETFLTFLVPDQEDPLWVHAQKAAKQALTRGAPYKETHRDKADIHTWLAWQDPPGPSLGIALKRKCLDPTSPHAGPFIRWFRQLFQV